MLPCACSSLHIANLRLRDLESTTMSSAMSFRTGRDPSGSRLVRRIYHHSDRACLCWMSRLPHATVSKPTKPSPRDRWQIFEDQHRVFYGECGDQLKSCTCIHGASSSHALAYPMCSTPLIVLDHTIIKHPRGAAYVLRSITMPLTYST
jgi:hypothetical protein